VSTATATGIADPTPTVGTRPTARTTWSLRRTTLIVGLVASAAVAALAALFHAAGVSFDVHGAIPIAAFAQMTFLGAVAGGVIAAMLRRRSVEPARRFVQVAVALTAVSCVPSVVLPSDVATKLALVATHLVAAAIIVPVLARNLDA
jgi:hypothetical protein